MTQRIRRLIVCTVGTRPEIVKMAPVVAALRQQPDVDCLLVTTGQHVDLLHPAFDFFHLLPDLELPPPPARRGLGELVRHLSVRLAATFSAQRPDLVLAAGDTCSVLSTAWCCFQQDIPFGHVEAGLRTHNLRAPYPEEPNRVLVSRLASLHFAPTPLARQNLLDEGVADERIHVTGNPVIDALYTTASPLARVAPPSNRPRRLLITVHRRENLGGRLLEICRALAALVRRHRDLRVKWPLHPNPALQPIVRDLLGEHPHITLLPPLDYPSFVAAMEHADLVLTDSGGVQEEAPALGKPVLILRASTERQETVEAGVAKLAGTSAESIQREVTRLLTDRAAYQAMSRRVSPYGDGLAGPRIAARCARFLTQSISEGRSYAA